MGRKNAAAIEVPSQMHTSATNLQRAAPAPSSAHKSHSRAKPFQYKMWQLPTIAMSDCTNEFTNQHQVVLVITNASCWACQTEVATNLCQVSTGALTELTDQKERRDRRPYDHIQRLPCDMAILRSWLTTSVARDLDESFGGCFCTLPANFPSFKDAAVS